MKKTAVILTLALAVALLAACGKVEQLSASPQAAAAAAVSGEYPMIVASGKSVKTDLNGDGTEDTVLCEPYSTADAGRIKTLSVNGAQFTKVVADQGFYMDTPLEDYYAITDIDTSDKYLEIAVMDYGPSDDCITDFFRYDGQTLKFLGSVSGLIRDSSGVSDLSFKGNGLITSFMRLNVFQTWYATVDWKLDDGGFTVVPQDVYYSNMESGTAVTAKTAVTVYSDKSAKSEKTTLPAGTVMTVLGTDNAEWVLASEASGNKLWLHVDPQNGFHVETPSGYAEVQQVFDGLCMAD